MNIQDYIPKKEDKKSRDERIAILKNLEAKINMLDEKISNGSSLPDVPYYRLCANAYKTETRVNEYSFYMLKHYYNAFKEFKNTALKNRTNVEKDIEKCNMLMTYISDIFSITYEYKVKIDNGCNTIVKLCDRSEQEDQPKLFMFLNIAKVIQYILTYREAWKEINEKTIRSALIEINDYLQEIKFRFNYEYKIEAD